MAKMRLVQKEAAGHPWHFMLGTQPTACTGVHAQTVGRLEPGNATEHACLLDAVCPLYALCLLQVPVKR